MHRSILLYFFLVFYSTYITAQMPECNQLTSYTPFAEKHMPVKKVRLVIHVIQKADGSGNLHKDSASEMDFFKKVIHHANWPYTEVDSLHPNKGKTKLQWIKDSRIRLEVDTIIFHRDDDLYYFQKHACVYDQEKKDSVQVDGKLYLYGENLYKKFVQESKHLSKLYKDSALNVFLVEGGKFSGRGIAENLYSSKWLVVVGIYQYMYFSYDHPNHWTPGMVMAHEAGHNMGLEHPYNFHACTDLPSTGRGITNNLMDCWPTQGRSLTPCQLASLHFGLSGGSGSISRAFKNDWCVYDSTQNIIIEKGENTLWDSKMFIPGDVIIKNGGTLTIRCETSMSSGSKILVCPGGRLLLDGGHITNFCGGRWDGIYLEKNKRVLWWVKNSRSIFNNQNNGYFERTNFGIVKKPTAFFPR